MDVIPAVDVLDGVVVRLRQGRYDDVTVYADDPAVMAQSWVEQGASLVHVVDLAGARSGIGDEALWRRLGEAGISFQLGGGIRTAEAARAVIGAGAERVVLGTAAVWKPDLVETIVADVGGERVVAAIDVEGGRATGAGWLDGGRELGTVLRDLSRAGVKRVLATGISRDGMLSGPDVELLDGVRKAAPDMALIASGGVGSLDDIATVAELDVEAVIVGRALYDGRFTFVEAAAVAG